MSYIKDAVKVTVKNECHKAERGQFKIDWQINERTDNTDDPFMINVATRRIADKISQATTGLRLLSPEWLAYKYVIKWKEYL
jgi:uncharacterized protein YcnI